MKLENKASFKEKVLGQNGLVWGFETVAIKPNTGNGDGLFNTARDFASQIGTEMDCIDALLLPDLDGEEVSINGIKKSYAYPMDYGLILRLFPNANAVIYRRTHQAGFDKHRRWIIRAAIDGFKSVIAVGNSSSKKSYSGISPLEFASLVQQISERGLADIIQGGICIPSRANELERMLQKESAGISYFVTQYLFESANIDRLYEEYKRKSEETGKPVPRIVIGVTPITGEKNYSFLTNKLRVAIPEDARNKIFSDDKGTIESSIRYISELLKRFFDKYQKDESVRFGVYVGYTSAKSLPASVEMFGRLREELRGYSSRSSN